MHRVIINLTDEQYKALKEFAMSVGLNISDTVRWALVAESYIPNATFKRGAKAKKTQNS